MYLCFPRRKQAPQGYLADGARLARIPSNYTDNEPTKASKPTATQKKPKKGKHVKSGGVEDGLDAITQTSMVNTQLHQQAMLAIVMVTGSEYQPPADHSTPDGGAGHGGGGHDGGGHDGGGIGGGDGDASGGGCD
ncbi:hypothetical protein FOBRF1_007461 [Fusarium oxysporum]